MFAGHRCECCYGFIKPKRLALDLPNPNHSQNAFDLHQDQPSHTFNNINIKIKINPRHRPSFQRNNKFNAFTMKSEHAGYVLMAVDYFFSRQERKEVDKKLRKARGDLVYRKVVEGVSYRDWDREDRKVIRQQCRDDPEYAEAWVAEQAKREARRS